MVIYDQMPQRFLIRVGVFPTPNKNTPICLDRWVGVGEHTSHDGHQKKP